jgi:hypothetical protein
MIGNLLKSLLAAGSLSGIVAAEALADENLFGARAYTVSTASGDLLSTQGVLMSGGNEAFLVAEVLGARCVTPVGWCPIAPQPVGAPCVCGDTSGITSQ